MNWCKRPASPLAVCVFAQAAQTAASGACRRSNEGGAFGFRSVQNGYRSGFPREARLPTIGPLLPGRISVRSNAAEQGLSGSVNASEDVKSRERSWRVWTRAKLVSRAVVRSVCRGRVEEQLKPGAYRRVARWQRAECLVRFRASCGTGRGIENKPSTRRGEPFTSGTFIRGRFLHVSRPFSHP